MDPILKLNTVTISESGVDFQGKKLKLDGEEDCKEIVDAIKACKNLVFLNLEGNTLGVKASKIIGKALESKSELKRALWMDMFTGRTKDEIPKALLNLGSGLNIAGARLSELDVSDNALGPVGVEAIAGLLSSSTCHQLQQLRLNNNGLGTEGGKMLARALLQCYKDSVKEGRPLALKQFVAGRNRLEDKGAKALSEVFKTLGSLEEVSLPQNGINPQGIKLLCHSFIKNTNLKKINLTDNTVKKSGAISLAKALPHLQKLKWLYLDDCLLKTSGAAILAQALTDKHTDLERLHLSDNEIGYPGGLALINAMKNKGKLKYVGLNGNRFGEKRESLREEITKNNQLATLYSLSDAEGEESEEERDESDDDDESDEDDGEIDESSFSSPPKFENKLQKNERNSDPLANSFESFSITDSYDSSFIDDLLKSPSPDNLRKVTRKMITDYIQAKQNSSPNFYVDTLIPMIMKISSINCIDEKLRTFRSDVSDNLYKELFNWASGANKITLVNNQLIVHLGLIKCEDRDFKVSWDTKSALMTLKSAISKGITPDSTKEVLNSFIERQSETLKTGDKTKNSS